MTLYEKVLEEVSKQESNTEDWDGLSEEQQFIFVSLIKEKMDVLNADQVNDLFISFLRKGTLEEEDFSSLLQNQDMEKINDREEKIILPNTKTKPEEKSPPLQQHDEVFVNCQAGENAGNKGCGGRVAFKTGSFSKPDMRYVSFVCKSCKRGFNVVY